MFKASIRTYPVFGLVAEPGQTLRSRVVFAAVELSGTLPLIHIVAEKGRHSGDQGYRGRWSAFGFASNCKGLGLFTSDKRRRLPVGDYTSDTGTPRCFIVLARKASAVY